MIVKKKSAKAINTKKETTVTKTTKGSLITGVLEKIPSGHFEAVGKELRDVLKKQPGIYSLYKDDRIYYVGLASNLFGRIKHHLRDKHKGEWNYFSIFIVKRVKFLKDLETSLIRIAKPKGNKRLGRIHNHGELQQILKKSIREKKRVLNKKMKTKDTEIKHLKNSIEQVELALKRK